MHRCINNVELELMPKAVQAHDKDCKSFQKSFNNRCFVELSNNGHTVYLRSYDTIIAKVVNAKCDFERVNRNGKSVRVVVGVVGDVVERYWDAEQWQQATTLKHIVAFCGLHKKEFMALPRKSLKVYMDLPEHDNNAD